MGGVEGGVVEEVVAGEGFGICGGTGGGLVWVFWLLGGFFGGEGGRTVGVELVDVDVAVGVCEGEVELFFRGEEGGGDYFDGVGGFAEEAELVGLFLWVYSMRVSGGVSFLWVGGFCRELVPCTRRTRSLSPRPPSDTAPFLPAPWPR